MCVCVCVCACLCLCAAILGIGLTADRMTRNACSQYDGTRRRGNQSAALLLCVINIHYTIDLSEARFFVRSCNCSLGGTSRRDQSDGIEASRRPNFSVRAHGSLQRPQCDLYRGAEWLVG